jgi:circadian clock protein KaiC
MGSAATSRIKKAPVPYPAAALKKAPTGISGFDLITSGGLPAGRPSIVCGGPGCGKTMFAMEFLVRGAMEFNEPGVLLTFEETGDEMTRNVASLGFDLPALVRRKKISIDYVRVEPSEIQETGEYDLEALFIRLQYAVDSIGAKRVALDTLEAVFSGFSNAGTLRAEIRRLFRWLKDRNLTTVVTAERGEGSLTRYGLEEYVSDCVIFLDHRVTEQISTRRMRIVKYRGSAHGTDEYPFLIDHKGFSVLPLSALRLDHKVSEERVSSGIPDLDTMLEGKGFYKGTSVLVSGTSGSGKSTLAAHFANATCVDGKRAIYIAFEESPDQIMRNMRSIGLNLNRHVRKGLLRFAAWRPSQHGLETHLLRIHDMVEEFSPEVVIVDPITNLISSGHSEIYSMLMRLLDFLKSRQITAMFLNLTNSPIGSEHTDLGISSLTDTWILTRDLELNGERNRALYVLKSRGMAHSNQIREFVLSHHGVKLLPVYSGSGTVYTGSARVAQESRERAEALRQQHEIELLRKQAAAKQQILESQIAALRSELAVAQSESLRFEAEQKEEAQRALKDAQALNKVRGITSTATSGKRGQ